MKRLFLYTIVIGFVVQSNVFCAEKRTYDKTFPESRDLSPPMHETSTLLALPNEVLISILQMGAAKATGTVCKKLEHLRLKDQSGLCIYLNSQDRAKRYLDGKYDYLESLKRVEFNYKFAVPTIIEVSHQVWDGDMATIFAPKKTVMRPEIRHSYNTDEAETIIFGIMNKFSRLTSLRFTSCNTPNLFHLYGKIGTLTSLTTLHIQETTVLPNSPKIFEKSWRNSIYLIKLTSLRNLTSFSLIGIGPSLKEKNGISEISCILKQVTALKKLDLSDNSLTHDDIKDLTSLNPLTEIVLEKPNNFRPVPDVINKTDT